MDSSLLQTQQCRKGFFRGVIPSAASPGAAEAPHFVQESTLSQTCSQLAEFVSSEVEGADPTAPESGREAKPPGSWPWQSHAEPQNDPGNISRICCTRQPRTTELHDARLCSMIHYPDLLNNSACGINGICHHNTSRMEPGSLRRSFLQRWQRLSCPPKLV